MPSELDVQGHLDAWQTSCRVTARFIEQLPASVWSAAIPGIPTRTVRTICAHLHNSRCSWVKTLGAEHGVPGIARVDHRKVTRQQLLKALKQSERGIGDLLRLGFRHGGRLPPSKRYVWRNLALDVAHVLTYFVAHEGHHRGQIVLVARQLEQRLSSEVTAGLWDWRTRPR
jgi:uncharacterized damage-inducible protein DinB